MKRGIDSKEKGKGAVSILDPVLASDIDSLSDLESFLQKTVEAAATIVDARHSKLVLFEEEGKKEQSSSENRNGNGVRNGNGNGNGAHSDQSITIPLILRGLEHPIGYIEVKERKDEQPFDDRDMVSVTMMGRQATLKIENDLFYRSIYENMVEMLKSLVNIIESRDPYIHCHSSRVANYALRIAHDLNLSASEKNAMRLASLLHDIGKIGIPDHILAKKGSLTTDEQDIIRTHAMIGEKIIKPVAFLFKEKDIILHHHEWFNGDGYPHGLKRDEIPLCDRIIAVADSFDAMTSNRPYRLAKSARESMKEIERCKSVKYDPRIVQSFKRSLESVPL